MASTYEWRTDKAGNRRYVRLPDKPVVQRISEGKPLAPVKVTAEAANAGEMAILPPDGNVIARVEPAGDVAALGVATTTPSKAAPRKPAKK